MVRSECAFSCSRTTSCKGFLVYYGWRYELEMSPRSDVMTILAAGSVAYV
jgi:hypothetical protein